MVEENIGQEFRLKNTDETRNYFLEKIKQNELMSKKDKKLCTTLNYTEHFLILAFTITLVGISIGIKSSAIRLKICAITAVTKKYKSVIKKKKRCMILLEKSKLNSIEVLISKVLIDSSISHDEFILINNMQ